MADATESAVDRDFRLKVLGRTLEHLGVQMYKRRDTAIAELVANSWDAGASEVEIRVPDGSLARDLDEITVQDDGSGMDPDAVQDQYLVIGRNRRESEDVEPPGRPVMGRKGIGKLAGFGIADTMVLETWAEGRTTSLTLDMSSLKVDAGEASDVSLPGRIEPGTPATGSSSSGTRLVLNNLKHVTMMDTEALKRSLARRFSRTVRGEMTIKVNGEQISEPDLDYEFRFPESEGEQTDHLEDGTEVRYWHGFTNQPVRSALLRGWTVLVRGKTAQAPDFFFGVEGTASGQHGTKYMTGVIEADFLDAGTDDESDLISTDRQEIDWEDPRTKQLHDWGAALTRRALTDRVNRRGDETVRYVYEQDEFSSRIDRLEPDLKGRVTSYLQQLGAADPENEKINGLADALIRAFEYRHFHDVVDEIEAAGTSSPVELEKLLTHLHEWKVLESRAILEIVNGRLEIVNKLAVLLVEDAPETAPREGMDNLHDLLGDYPWLIHPEWQVLAEETRLTTLFREWEESEVDSEERQRIDFLALAGDGRIRLIELKRAGHAVSLAEIVRLDEYAAKLERSTNKGIDKVLVYGGQFEFSYERKDIELLEWGQMQENTRAHYEHYQAVLEGNVVDPSFADKQGEVQRTREVTETGSSYRGPARREANRERLRETRGEIFEAENDESA